MIDPKIIFVGGAQGTGKTTLLRAVKKKLGKNIVHFEVGKQSRTIAKRKFLKHLKDLTPRERKRVQKLVLNKILSIRGQIVLLASHHTERSPSEDDTYTDLTNAQLSPYIVHHILVEAPLDEVRKRRILDNKPRSYESEKIRREIVSQRFIAREEARKIKRPLSIVRNDANKEKNAIQAIERIVCKYF